MNPEKARELRDGKSRQRASPFSPQPGTRKHRELRFNPQHPEEVAEAHKLLAGLDGMDIEAGLTAHSLSIWYDVNDYTLEGLEAALKRQGFHLDNGVFNKISSALAHFCEETQLRNMHGPQRLLKKSHDIYSKAWDQHAHGDHDETPPDLRKDH